MLVRKTSVLMPLPPVISTTVSSSRLGASTVVAVVVVGVESVVVDAVVVVVCRGHLIDSKYLAYCRRASTVKQSCPKNSLEISDSNMLACHGLVGSCQFDLIHH